MTLVEAPCGRRRVGLDTAPASVAAYLAASVQQQQQQHQLSTRLARGNFNTVSVSFSNRIHCQNIPKSLCVSPFLSFPFSSSFFPSLLPQSSDSTLAKHRILFRFRAFCLFFQSQSRLVTVRLAFFPGKTSSSSRFSNSFSTATAVLRLIYLLAPSSVETVERGVGDCRLALLLLLPSCRACLAFFLCFFMYSTNSHSLY